DRFNQAVKKVLAISNSTSKSGNASNAMPDEDIFIKSGHEILKLKSREILYIKSDGDYTEAITLSKKYLSYCSLKEWLNKLEDHFCQVHKSYIINMNHLTKISSNKVHLTDKHLIPIGRAYKKIFIEKKCKVLKNPADIGKNN